MAGYKFDTPDDEARCREFIGPVTADQQLRLAIQYCWMSLPKAHRTPEEMEKHIRRMVDRAIRDFREDYQHFFDDKVQ